MITATPAMQPRAPMTSHRSGRNPSRAMPQASEPATNTTVGGQDPTEMGVRLQCGEEPIDPKRNNSESRPKPTPLLADALPYQPRATDLRNRRQDE